MCLYRSYLVMTSFVVTGFVVFMMLMVMIIILVILFEVTVIPEFLLVSVFFFVVHMFETLSITTQKISIFVL